MSSKIDFEQVKADYVRIARSDSALELDKAVKIVNDDLPLFSHPMSCQMQALAGLRMRAALTPASKSDALDAIIQENVGRLDIQSNEHFELNKEELARHAETFATICSRLDEFEERLKNVESTVEEVQNQPKTKKGQVEDSENQANVFDVRLTNVERGLAEVSNVLQRMADVSADSVPSGPSYAVQMYTGLLGNRKRRANLAERLTQEREDIVVKAQQLADEIAQYDEKMRVNQAQLGDIQSRLKNAEMFLTAADRDALQLDNY